MATAEGIDVRLTLTSDLRIGFEGGQASARTLLKEGDVRFVALSWGGAVPPSDFAEAYRRQVWTAHHWQHWLARGQFPDHPWRSYLQRSALTLKGLTYAPTGAVTAAGTTSLPETPGGGRNYDYRFTWIRDATFALWGLYSLGFDWEAVDFFSFIADLAEVRTTSRSCTASAGRRSSPSTSSTTCRATPTRDRCGSATPRTPEAARRLGSPARLGVPALQGGRPPRQPDLADPGQAGQPGAEVLAGAGRRHLGGPRRAQHFTSSKIMCWVAVDRGAKIARMTGEEGKAAEWELAAQEIKDDILANGVDKRGVLTQYYGTRRSTRRCCWRRWCGSCPPTTSASARRCWPSPTS